MIQDNKRIAKNTLLLYFRMFLLIAVQLYTVPIILKALGVIDYGIYNVVGGVVTMFSFLGSMLASGSQRFIAYSIGGGNKKELKETFDTTVTIYLFFAVIAFLLLECIGTWFLNTKMNIPQERMGTANWVYQLSVVAFLVNLIAIPYNAVIIAHEKMSFFAYISILECLLKLVSALILQYVLVDRLIVYACLICAIAVLIRTIYQISCRFFFEECRHYRFTWNSQTGKALLTYSGWNVVGSIALLSRQQGLNIILNLFFGPLLNAAHSIAQQINGVLTQFINNIYMATRPQITKLYAAGNIFEMWSLVFSSSRLSFYLLMYLSIPVLIELDVVLHVWLGDIPQYTVGISRLMIISILIEAFGNQVIAAYQAANRIKKYQLYSSTIILLNIPLSYILLRIHSVNPLLPYILSALLSILYTTSILYNARKEIGLNIRLYCKKVVCKLIVIFCIVWLSVFYTVSLFPSTVLRVVLTVLLTILLSSLTIWLIGLEHVEKDFIKKYIIRKLQNK